MQSAPPLPITIFKQNFVHFTFAMRADFTFLCV